MLPNFLIIGAPRAGTTWIAKNLMLHPQVCLPRRKEIHFFDREYERGIVYYEKFFNHCGSAKAVGEGTPEYMYKAYVPPLIKRHLPDVKLIASLRNPVDRLYSRYWHAKARFIENKDISFEEKIKQKPVFIEEGYYYDQIMRYREFFPAERMLIVFFDDLLNEPRRLLAEICEFLELDVEFESPIIQQRINAASVKGSLAKSRLLYYFYRAFSSINAVKPADYIAKVNETSIPPMNAKTKEWLVNEVYREKNKMLEDLLGRDLQSWNTI